MANETHNHPVRRTALTPAVLALCGLSMSSQYHAMPLSLHERNRILFRFRILRMFPSSAMGHQKSTICHAFLVGLTSSMASNRPSGDGIAYPMKLLEWSRTETLPSSAILSNALSRC